MRHDSLTEFPIASEGPLMRRIGGVPLTVLVVLALTEVPVVRADGEEKAEAVRDLPTGHSK